MTAQRSSKLGLAIVLGIILVGSASLAVGMVWISGAERITPPAPSPVSLGPVPSPTLQLPKTPSKAAVAVLGDSFAAGEGAENQPGWVDRLTSEMCWSVAVNSAQGGTGYALVDPRTDPNNVVFSQRVDAVVAAKPNIVIVEGGVNDAQADSQKIFDGASATFQSLRNGLGHDVPIIAVGAVSGPKDDPANLARVNSAIGGGASSFGVGFIDPVQEQWLSASQLWTDDGFHPNAAGYVEYAKRLGDELVRFGAKKCD
jgi:acyl-CoA thioesterase I